MKTRAETIRLFNRIYGIFPPIHTPERCTDTLPMERNEAKSKVKYIGAICVKRNAKSGRYLYHVISIFYIIDHDFRNCPFGATAN